MDIRRSRPISIKQCRKELKILRKSIHDLRSVTSSIRKICNDLWEDIDDFVKPNEDLKSIYQEIQGLFQTCLKSHDDLTLSNSLAAMGTIHKLFENQSKAHECYRRSIHSGQVYDDELISIENLWHFNRYFSDIKITLEPYILKRYFEDAEMLLKNCKSDENVVAISICNFYKGLAAQLSMRDPKETLKYFRKVLKAIPKLEQHPFFETQLRKFINTSNVKHQIGLIHFNLKNYTLAAKVFEQVIIDCGRREESFNTLSLGLWAMFHRAVCHYNNYDYEDALKSFERFLQYADTHPMVPRLLQLDPQVEQFKREAIAMKGDVKKWLQLKQIEEVRKYGCKKKLDRKDRKLLPVDEEANELLNDACEATDKEHFLQAFSYLDQAERIKNQIYNGKIPIHDLCKILQTRALCLFRIEKVDEAIGILVKLKNMWERKGTLSTPDSMLLLDVYDHFSHFYDKLNYAEETMHFAKKAFKLSDLHDRKLYLRAGNSCIEMKKWQKARQYIEKSLKLTSDKSPEGLIMHFKRLSSCHYGLKDYAKALDFLMKGHQIVSKKYRESLSHEGTSSFKEFPETLFCRDIGICLRKLRRFDEAKDWFDKFIDSGLRLKKDICEVDKRVMVIEVPKFYKYYIDFYLCEETLWPLQQFLQSSKSEKQLDHLQNLIRESDGEDISKIRSTFKNALDAFPFGNFSCFFVNQFDNLYLYHNSGLITDLFKSKRYR